MPPEEIPAILKQAKAIVEKLVWKARYGVNLLGTVGANHYTSPTKLAASFTEIHKYASPQKSKRSWHLDLKDVSPKPSFYNQRDRVPPTHLFGTSPGAAQMAIRIADQKEQAIAD